MISCVTVAISPSTKLSNFSTTCRSEFLFEMFVLPDVKPWSQILTDEPTQFENVSRKYCFFGHGKFTAIIFQVGVLFFPIVIAP